jgi:subfamily B ATP-binding cassette protein MsbA
VKRFLPYYRYLRPVLPHFFAAVACGAVYGVASGFGLPFLMEKVLPVVFGDAPAAAIVLVKDWHGFADWPPLTIPADYALIVAVALLPVIFAIRAVAHFGNVYLLNYVGLRVLEGVRAAVFERIQRLHLAFFKRHSAGDLTSRVMVDTNHVKTVVVEVSNDILIQPFTLVGALGYFSYLAWREPAMGRFLLALLVIPAVVFPVRAFGRKLRRRSEQTLGHMGNLSAVLTENLQSLREVRAYNLEERETRRFRGLVRELLRAQLKVVKYEKMLPPVIEFASACSIAFAIYQAALARVSQENVLALVTALYIAYEPVKRLGNMHNKIKTGAAGLARLEEVLHAPIEVADPLVPTPMWRRLDCAASSGTGVSPALPPVAPVARESRPCPSGVRGVRGDVRFDAVTFAYDRKPVLRDVDIAVAAGEVVALVGPSGAGKSTFANLVPRFYDPQSGAVRVDGLDVRAVAQAELRANIALVSQEPVLFADSVFNNILLGRPGATRTEVVEAAERAGARGFIEALPQGWDASVGERGGRLSGGQRQRVAIARAFLKDAPILILDEATSALDAENEAVVQGALEQLARGKTTFIIAHRFSTIRFATRILVFDCGAVVADGTHEKLLTTSPLYRALYQRQSAEG